MKKIQVLIIFALAIGFFGLLFYWRQENRKEAESLDGLQKIYNEYDKKIRVIRNDMEKRKSEADDVEKPGNVIFAFSEEDQELMSRIVPALESRGIRATLVLKNSEDHDQEMVTQAVQRGWDLAFGGEIGDSQEAYVETLKETSKQYQESAGQFSGAFFFNGKEYGKGSRILYPQFTELTFKIGVAFAKDASDLTHGTNTDYGMAIEECQNVSMREDLETLESLLDKVVESRSVVVLSDFGLDRQMEIAAEAPLDHFEQLLDLVEQKQAESDLAVGSVTDYLSTLEERDNKIEQRQQEYLEYEQECQKEINRLMKERDDLLGKNK